MRRTFTVSAFAALVVLGLLAHPVPVYAQDPSLPPSYQPEEYTDRGRQVRASGQNTLFPPSNSPTYFGGPSQANAAFIGGIPVVRIRTSSSGYTPEQRAEEVQNRLNDALSEGPIHTQDITTAQLGLDAAVYVKGKLLMTIDPDWAKSDNSTSIVVANEYAAKLREIIPPLTAPHQ